MTWQLKKEQPLEVLILDKTVPNDTYREHKGLSWLLNHQKYTHTNGNIYDYTQDYVGFKPLPNQEYKIETILDVTQPKYDLIYIADTYGVYENDFFQDEAQQEKAELIYGGITEEEISHIHNLAFESEATLVVEFNSFASPTQQPAREKFTDLLNITWTGWTGCFFPELGSDLPNWITREYEAYSGEEWNYAGPGYVLVSEKNEFIVLEQGKDSGDKGIRLEFTEAGTEEFGLSSSPPYYYWFDIITPVDEEEVLAYYHWDLTDSGIAKLEAQQLPVQFPAVTKTEKYGFPSYYFAGDYVDIDSLPFTYQMSGLSWLKSLTSIDRIGDPQAFFWTTYAPMMQSILSKTSETLSTEAVVRDVFTSGDLKYNSRTSDHSLLEIYRDGNWEDLIIKGVNIGMGRPGSWPGEAAITEDAYYRWFTQIGEMNANAVRVYTLHPPGFYRALARYNQTTADPIYVFHGMWIDEEELVQSQNAFDEVNDESFNVEIRNVIDAVHGNITIPQQRGHAFGTYSADISTYVLGWIIGIEWDPEMVLNTNEANDNLSDFAGDYFITKDAEPFEVWLAEKMEYVVAYEMEQYQWQRPLSFTNWPTTDILSHPAEPTYFEDLVSVNPNTIIPTESLEAGYFASYHVYPYYPDFLNFEPSYLEYVDQRGQKNTYAGYLHELRQVHDMPVLIAEFGLPSSRGLTHTDPYGLNQGFLTETEQGEGVAYLYETIVAEDMMGGMLFVWQDEWFKRTWNTMHLDMPDHRPLWSNVQTNEQRFGLVSFDPNVISIDGVVEDWENVDPLFEREDSEDISALYVTHDEAYLYVRLDYNDTIDIDNLNTMILFNTVENQGITSVVGNDINEGADFVLHLNGRKTSRLLVDSYYDSFYHFYKDENFLEEKSYATVKDNGIFHPIQMLTSKPMLIPSTGQVIPYESHETGKLRYGISNPDSPDYESLADFYSNGNTVELRIPWQILNITDPSHKKRLGSIQDGKWETEKDITEFSLKAVTYTSDRNVPFEQLEDVKFLDSTPWSFYDWEPWVQPQYKERLKDSYYIIQEAFSKKNR